MERIIQNDRSIILAADVVSFQELNQLTIAIKGVDGVGAAKLGFSIGLKNLKQAVDAVKFYTDNPSYPVIYDHQKAANDIPETATQFAAGMKDAGVDAVILFPFTGPATQERWTKTCLDAGLQVITGGIMTHERFLFSEGGYIADEAVFEIYRNACKLGCQHFVVPGNKVAWVQGIRSLLEHELNDEFVLYAPGFITQNGDISECGRAAGKRWHAIVGSAIYKQPTFEAQRQAAKSLVEQMRKAA